jgi:hypothetical protein
MRDDYNEENERVLGHLRRNDPALKELTLEFSTSIHVVEMIFRAFDAIATNTSLEILNINDECGLLYLCHTNWTDLAKRACSLNTSLKDIRIATPSSDMKVAVGIALSSPNVEAVTIYVWSPSLNDVTAVAQVLRVATRLLSLTIEGFYMYSDTAVAFAAAFHGSRAIKTLIMKRSAMMLLLQTRPCATGRKKWVPESTLMDRRITPLDAVD